MSCGALTAEAVERYSVFSLFSPSPVTFSTLLCVPNCLSKLYVRQPV